MGRFWHRSLCIILLIAVFFCGYILGGGNGDDVKTSLSLPEAVGQALDTQAALEYLQGILAQCQDEAVRHAVECLTTWLEELPN